MTGGNCSIYNITSELEKNELKIWENMDIYANQKSALLGLNFF